MLQPSHPMLTTSLTKWITSLPDSLANLSQKLENEKAPKTIDGFGPQSWTSLAKFDHHSSSWRTSQTSLTNMKHFVKFSQPWPKAGSMLNGSIYKRQKSVQIIKEIVSFSLPTNPNTFISYPTPTTSDIIGGVRKPTPNRPMAQKLRDQILQPYLFPTPTTALNMLSPSFLTKSQSHRNIRATLPTPTTNDAPNQTFPKSQKKRNSLVAKIMEQKDLNGGKPTLRLSPLFVEWMMGFPTGWTDLERSATPSFPIKPTSHTPTSSTKPKPTNTSLPSLNNHSGAQGGFDEE